MTRCRFLLYNQDHKSTNPGNQLTSQIASNVKSSLLALYTLRHIHKATILLPKIGTWPLIQLNAGLNAQTSLRRKTASNHVYGRRVTTWRLAPVALLGIAAPASQPEPINSPCRPLPSRGPHAQDRISQLRRPTRAAGVHP